MIKFMSNPSWQVWAVESCLPPEFLLVPNVLGPEHEDALHGEEGEGDDAEPGGEHHRLQQQAGPGEWSWKIVFSKLHLENGT